MTPSASTSTEWAGSSLKSIPESTIRQPAASISSRSRSAVAQPPAARGQHPGPAAARRGGSPNDSRPIRGLGIDVANELRPVRVIQQLADRDDLAGVKPVVVDDAEDRVAHEARRWAG